MVSDIDIEDIESMRSERGITKQTLSVCMGFESGTGYAVAESRGYMSEQRREDALEVFDYYDENGYVPMPREIGIEETTPVEEP